jgi:hypothetical protein
MKVSTIRPALQKILKFYPTLLSCFISFEEDCLKTLQELFSVQEYEREETMQGDIPCTKAHIYIYLFIYLSAPVS